MTHLNWFIVSILPLFWTLRWWTAGNEALSVPWPRSVTVQYSSRFNCKGVLISPLRCRRYTGMVDDTRSVGSPVNGLSGTAQTSRALPPSVLPLDSLTIHYVFCSRHFSTSLCITHSLTPLSTKCRLLHSSGRLAMPPTAALRKRRGIRLQPGRPILSQ